MSFLFKNISRRSFFKNFLIALAALPAFAGYNPRAGFSTAFAADPTKPLDPEAPMPKSLGYTPDNTKVDLVKFPKKAGPDGAKQKCSGCVLFLEGGKKIEGQKGEWGKCGLFPDGLVSADGWCNSFAPKV